MKILITGAAGYVGSVLAKQFQSQELLLVDNYSSTDSDRPKILGVGQHEIINADISDRDVAEDITKNIDVIYHLAAVSGIPRCEQNLASYLSNVVGTAYLGMCAEINDVKKIIFASTSAVYGESQVYNITETHRIKPRSRYGWQKYAAETVLTSLKIPVIIFRKSNIFGDGYFHKQVAVDVFIDKVKAGEDITIHGKGTQRRDYVHLDDVVDAYVQAIYWDSGVYNIGGNDNLSVNELADLIISLGKGKSKKVYQEQRETERLIKNFNYDCSRAKSMGYHPKKRVEDEVRRRLECNIP